MRCEESESLIEAYADQELPAAQSAAVAEHLRTCDSCQRRYQAVIDLRASLQRHCMVGSPVELRRNIEKLLHRSPTQSLSATLLSRSLPTWAAYALSIAFGVLIGWQSTLLLLSDSREESVQSAILSAHITSLMVDHVTDVPSSDRHTVKPWFTGKLNFAPPVMQFDDEEFMLLGGRLEYIGGQSTAALVYKRRQHVLNLFIWPAAGEQAISQISVKGYNLVKWRSNGLQYYLISDLNSRELAQFGALFHARTQIQTESQ